MKPRKPRVLWAFFDCNGHLGGVHWFRKVVVQWACEGRYEDGGKAVKFVEAPRKAKARKAGRRK